MRPSAALGNGYSRFTLTAVGASLLATLVGCADMSALTKERVAQSETSVQQAQQAVGRSEAGAIELQQAKDKLSEAKNALASKQPKAAEHSAAQAHLYAELAIAKSQSASARKAAEEVLASLEVLRTETERASPTQP
jgi:hypothetical protein